MLVRDSPSTEPIELVLVAAGRCVDARRRDLERMVQEAEAPHERRAVLRTDARGHDGVHRAVLADQRKVSKEQLAALIVNLAWNGLSRMKAKPELRFEGEKAKKAAQRAAENDGTEETRTESPLRQPLLRKKRQKAAQRCPQLRKPALSA